MGKRDKRLAWYNSRSKNVLPRGHSSLKKGNMVAKAENDPKLWVLEEGHKLNQSLVNNHFVLTGQWRQVQPVLSEARNETRGSASGFILRKHAGRPFVFTK